MAPARLTKQKATRQGRNFSSANLEFGVVVLAEQLQEPKHRLHDPQLGRQLPLLRPFGDRFIADRSVRRAVRRVSLFHVTQVAQVGVRLSRRGRCVLHLCRQLRHHDVAILFHYSTSNTLKTNEQTDKETRLASAHQQRRRRRRCDSSTPSAKDTFLCLSVCLLCLSGVSILWGNGVPCFTDI